MMLMNIISLALATLVGTAPRPTAYANRCVVATEDSVLTVDVLKRMTKFWALFMKEPDSIRTAGHSANQKQVTLTIDSVSAGASEVHVKVVDMVVMATKYPSVAADLKQTDFTAPQWEAYRNVLLGASYTAQAAKLKNVTPALTSTVGKNVAFLNTHIVYLNRLKETGMWFPPVQEGGGTSDGDSPKVDWFSPVQ